MSRRVAITGMGWVTTHGIDLNEAYGRLLNGESGVKTVVGHDLSKHTVKFGGEIVDFKPTDWIDAREAKRLDRFVQFANVASIKAVEDAGLDFDKEDRERCAAIIGSGIGGIYEFEDGHAKLIAKGPSRVSPMMIPKLMVNAAPANVAITHGLQGTNYGVVTACASAGHSMADGYEEILRGDSDVVVTGGSEAAMTELGVACFASMRALSTRNDEPHRASRPFDKDRDGFVMAEGAGLMIFEELEHAKARGARIYAEVLGWGATCDAGHITAPNKEGKGAQAAMRKALKRAGLNPEDVQHINTHATSTSLGDMAEVRAIKAVFGDHAPKIAINSTKSMTGHLLGASGGVEGITAVKALETGDVCPTINLENPEEETEGLNLVPNEAQHHDNLEIAMSNSFGFGGHNVSLVFKKWS